MGKDTHRLLAYDKIMQRLSNNKLIVDIQILDNKASAEYKRDITKKWNDNYQLVPPNTHRSNAAECAIREFKAHFLSILAGFAPYFPQISWEIWSNNREYREKLGLERANGAFSCVAPVCVGRY